MGEEIKRKLSLSKRHSVNEEKESTRHILVQQKDLLTRHLVEKRKDEEDNMERRTDIGEKEIGKDKVANNVGKDRELEVADNVDVTKGACLKTSTSLIKVTGR